MLSEFHADRSGASAGAWWRAWPQRADGDRRPTRLPWSSRGCLFTFHRVAAEDAWADLPNRGFHIDAGFLDRLLGWLGRQGWDVVTISEAARRMRDGGGARFVNFSVDDAYRDTWERAVPLFRRHGVPLTVYVTTGIPDGTDRMWAAGLESVLSERDQVVTEGRRLDVRAPRAKRAAFRRLLQDWEPSDPVGRYEAFCRQNGYVPEALRTRHAVTWDMLEAMRDDPLVELGAHTIHHPRLSALPDGDAWQEIAGSRERLTQRLGIPIQHFAFPYGRRADCGAREFRMTREAGFATAATTTKAILTDRRQEPSSLPRITLNGNCRSLVLAQAHLAGLSAWAARLSGRV